ncbi:hypothetical protein BZG36_02421 [Bifiguratus adelaidae]|uniref:Zn(2)-C6 fungal-type domain-containing protein n=1 Tax=Bifiguratus adelaidae TaxID=1938954 RepID=A0A261Y1C4_9FUNG|nr:hypothetical protein BZG36_02421 [Bifiguratus adelaidae]
MPETREDPGQSKRQRISRACDHCRRKKVKCDGAAPICGNCAALGCECQYLDTTKKRGPPKGYIEAIENRLASVQTALESLLTDGQSDQNAVRSILDELTAPLETPSGEMIHAKPTRRFQDSQQSSSRHSGLFSTPTDSASPHDNSLSANDSPLQDDDHEEEDDDLDNVNNALGELSIDEANSVRYLGRSSGFYLLQQSHAFHHGAFHLSVRGLKKASLLKYEADTELGIVNPLELPPTDLSEKLIEAYFEYIHPSFPVLRRSTFLESLEDPVNQPPLLLLNAIYAIASRVYPDQRTRRRPDAPETAGDIFFDRAKRLLDDDYDMSRISTVQALLLMAIHQNGAIRTARAWLYAGMAFRMAHDLGLNRNCENWNIDPIEREIRMRVFWSCFILDRYWAGSYGRALNFDERDIDVHYPKVSDYMQNNRPVKVGPVLVHFIHFIKLMEVMGKVLQTIYSARSKVIHNTAASNNVLTSLNSALTTWRANLPPQLQLPDHPARIEKENMQPTLSTVILHLVYHTVMILLHRPFIPNTKRRHGSLPTTIFPSLDICTSAADSIIDLAAVMQARHQVRYLHHMAIYPLFTAGIIFIHNATNPEPRLSVHGKINVNRTMNVLDDLSGAWQIATRMSNLLGDLAGLREIKIGDDGSFLVVNNMMPREVSQSNVLVMPNSPPKDGGMHLVGVLDPALEKKEDRASSSPIIDERRANSFDMQQQLRGGLRTQWQKDREFQSVRPSSLPNRGLSFTFPLQGKAPSRTTSLDSQPQSNNMSRSTSLYSNPYDGNTRPNSLNMDAFRNNTQSITPTSATDTNFDHQAEVSTQLSDPFGAIIFPSPEDAGSDRYSTSVSNNATPSLGPLSETPKQAFHGVPFSNDFDEWNAYMGQFSVGNSNMQSDVNTSKAEGAPGFTNFMLNTNSRSNDPDRYATSLGLEGYNDVAFW